MKKIKNNEKGFTLVEILAALLILTVLLIIAVPTVNNIIESSKDKTFFTSVSNIVNSLKPSMVLSGEDYCLYDYSKDTKNHTDSINTLYVLITKRDEKNIYSVFAKRKSDEIGIDIDDFSTLNINNSSEWVQTPTITEITNEDTLDFKSATEMMIEKLESSGFPSKCTIVDEVSE